MWHIHTRRNNRSSSGYSQYRVEGSRFDCQRCQPLRGTRFKEPQLLEDDIKESLPENDSTGSMFCVVNLTRFARLVLG